MVLITGISIAIRLLAVMWSIFLLRRIKDWRIGFLTIMFLLMAIRQSLTLWRAPASSLTDFTLASSELPGLIVSIMAFLSIFSLEKILTAPKKAEKNLKESEISLQKSQTLFHTLAKVSPVGIFHTDENGFCTFVNDRWCEISGLTFEEAQGIGWASALHPKDRDQVFAEWENFRRGGKTFQMEYRFLNASGKLSWVFGQAEAERDIENNVIGYVGAITDITQLKLTEIALKNSQIKLEQRVEERTADLVKANENLKSEMTERQRSAQALEESEDRFRKMFEEGGIGMVMANPEFCFTKTNRAFCEMIGYTEEELKAKTFLDITHPDDRGNNLDQIHKLVKQEIPSFQMEKRCVCKDGSIIWVSINVFIILVQGNEPSHRFIGMMENITHRKEIEEQLVESEEKFRQIAENVEEVFWMEDIEGSNIIYISPAFEKIWGVPLEELFKNPKLWMESIHPEDREKIEALKLYENREKLLSGTQKHEFRIIRPDGSIRWILDQAFPVLNAKGEPIRIVGISQDITDLKTAKEKAEQASRAKSEFLSHMSHELRTPLNAILGFAQLLELDKNHTLEPNQRESVGQIHIAGNHLLELINEVLDLTRIETGALNIFMENTDVSRLLKKLLPVVKTLAEEKNVKIHNHLSDTGPLYVTADPTRLKQALINLITNAIKYNHDGGEVFIKIETTDKNRIQIHVIDTGPGIESDKQQFIFDPFERLGAENSGVEGTGIGLTITKKLIGLMGGSLSMKSQMGKGSCFTIELSAGKTSEHASKGKSSTEVDLAQSNIGNQNHQTILYIEDNVSNLNLVQNFIEDYTSFQFIASQSAIDGVALARTQQPSLILMDIHLPEMDGIAAFKELQKYEETKSIPVIAVSANAMGHDVKSALDAGFKNYLTKPLNLSLLAETLQSTLHPTL